jgi:hypothetical protein
MAAAKSSTKIELSPFSFTIKSSLLRRNLPLRCPGAKLPAGENNTQSI